MKSHSYCQSCRVGVLGGLFLVGLLQLGVPTQALAAAASAGFASGISVLPPEDALPEPAPVLNLPPSVPAAASAPVPASASVLVPDPVALAPAPALTPVPVGCTPLSDQAMATDLAAVTAQSKKVDLGEQLRLFKDAAALWAQAATQCTGRAQERAVRNRDDNQQMLDRLAEKLDAGPQCASAHKNAGTLQDMARQALSERRWTEAGALFRKAENTWDLAAERCSGSQQDIAHRHRDQSAQDGHNAQFCAPLFEKAREHTQKMRSTAASLTQEDKHDASMVAETLWRDALAKCRGAAVLDIASNNAKALARERGTPWVARLPPAAPVVVASTRPIEPAAKSAGHSGGELAGSSGLPFISAVAAQPDPLRASPPAMTSTAPQVLLGAAPALAEGATKVEVATSALGVLTAGSTRFVGQFARDADAVTLSGTGKVTWANGDVFEGTMVKGLREGPGTFVWANGQRYTGDWLQDKPTGQASVHFVNGDDYEGQVLEGTPQGVGRMRYASGDVFEGQFSHGKPDVRGVYLWRNGQRFEGAWRNSRPNGQGKLKFATGNQYEGQVLDGVPQGPGRMVFSGGETYEGQFRNGEPDGQGSFNWPSGDSYVGQWLAGKKHGQGVFTWKSGDRWEGVYEQDVQKTEGVGTGPSAPG